MKKFKTQGEAVGYVLDNYIAEYSNPDYAVAGLPYYGMSVKILHHDCNRVITFKHIEDEEYSYELVSDVWGKDHDKGIEELKVRLGEWCKVKDYIKYIEADENYSS